MNEQLQAMLSESYGLNLQPSANNLAFFFTAKNKLSRLRDEQDKEYVLKEIPRCYFDLSSPENYFQGLNYFMAHLHERGLPLVEYLPTILGKIFIEATIEATENIYVLMPFEEGTLYSNDIEEVRQVALLHGKINLALEELTEDKIQFITKHNHNHFLRQGVPLVNLYEKVKVRLDALDRTAATELLEEVLPLVKANLDVLPDETYNHLPKQVTHKDIFPGNVLFKGEEKRPFLLDPDEFLYLPRIRDVAYAIWGFSTRKPPQKGVFPPDLEKASAYLESYLQEGVLTAEEINLLPQVMVRIWVEDVLHYSLLSSFTDEDKPNVERKINHLKHALEAQNEFRFE